MPETKRFIKPKVYMSNLLSQMQGEIKHPIYNMTLKFADQSFNEIAKIAVDNKDEKTLAILKQLCYV